MSKWYFITYFHSWFNFHESGEAIHSEVVFIPEKGSIASHITKYVKKASYYDECGVRGMPEGVSVKVRELSLLLPDGQKISGFKPKSIDHLFE